MKTFNLKQANKVLEHYENYLLRSIHVKYIAVIELESKKYSIEIGVTSLGKIKVVDNLNLYDVYCGNFPENIIPKHLPIPSKKITFRNTKKVTIKEINLSHITNENKEDQKDKSIFNKAFFNERFEQKNDWYSFPYGTQPIYSKDQKDKGTLGGFFRLKGFPGQLFGISNWHVISGKNSNLGDKLYDSNNNEIGKLFWSLFDLYRETAFVVFNDKVSNKLIKNYNLSDSSEFIIKKPKLGMKVAQLGYGTFTNHNSIKLKKSFIHSVNATIRIADGDDYTNGRKIFKKQLLIKHFSTPGDSGALLYTFDKNKTLVVGSIFAQTPQIVDILGDHQEILQYTVANNITHIFHKKFKQKQEVYIGKEKGVIKTKLINNFKINNIL